MSKLICISHNFCDRSSYFQSALDLSTAVTLKFWCSPTMHHLLWLEVLGWMVSLVHLKYKVTACIININLKYHHNMTSEDNLDLPNNASKHGLHSILSSHVFLRSEDNDSPLAISAIETCHYQQLWSKFVAITSSSGPSLSSHGHWRALAHFSNSRWPLAAAL